MDWSPSKLIRIESGVVSVSTNDLRALLAHYGVTDPETIDDLIVTSKNSKKSSWGEYRDVIGQPALTYFGFEASATLIRQYEPLLMPGLLQTEEYIRAVAEQVTTPKVTDVERYVRARLERQELLERDEIPEMFFILDEAVVRRSIGGSAVMQRQLEHLVDLGSRRRISIQIVPFDKGGYEGLIGPFTVLELDEDSVLFLENRNDTVTRDDADEIGRYVDLFQHFERSLATSPGDLSSFIIKINERAGGEAA